MSFVGASNNRMFADWSPWIQEPAHVWCREFRTLAARAEDLVSNDPFAAAMVAAKLNGTHGPSGLRAVSLYQADGLPQTTAGERAVRAQIDDAIARHSRGKTLDAEGALRRLALERDLDWMATVLGEGWAIRQFKPGRLGATLATCWRLVRPDRISNPDGRPNDDRLYEGLELDQDGQIAAIHVRQGTMGAFGYTKDASWIRVPMYAPDGSLNVMYRVGMRIPGMLRGVSMFAPLMLMTRQLQGTIEAHVAGKRAQACSPVHVSTGDPDDLASAQRVGAKLGPNTQLRPLSIFYTDKETEVNFLRTEFDGADLKEFMTLGYKLLTAGWQMPHEVVLAAMGEASLASARAGLDQFDRTCQGWQEDHIAQVSAPLDASIIREAAARGEVKIPANADWSRVMAGKYQRPPKYSTDRLKDANTLKALIEAGVSPTTSFSMFGFDYEDETEQKKRDKDFAGTQGVAPAGEDTAKAIPPATSVAFAVGDRVQPTIPPHMPGAEGPGTIEVIDATQPLGIRFDAMPDMIHKWYTSSEVEAAPMGNNS